jgi:hypothetical protein
MLDAIYLMYFKCRLQTLFNLNYIPTTLEVQSRNYVRGKRKKKVERQWKYAIQT